MSRTSDPQTSKVAAARLGDLTQLQTRVLGLFSDLMVATDQQLVDHYRTVWGTAEESTIRTRRKELSAGGLITEAGYGQTRSGNKCILWRVI